MIELNKAFLYPGDTKVTEVTKITKIGHASFHHPPCVTWGVTAAI